MRSAAAHGGDILLAHSGPPYLSYYSASDGLRRFGTRGAGPDDLYGPISVAEDESKEGQFLVWDWGGGRVLRIVNGAVVRREELGSAGRVGLGRKELSERSYFDQLRIGRLGDRYVRASYSRPVFSTHDMAHGRLEIAGPTLADPTPVAELGVMGKDRRELATVPVWSSCGESVAVWEPSRRSALLRDETGRVIASWSLRRTPEDTEPEHLEAFFKATARVELRGMEMPTPRAIRQMIRAHRHRFADSLPIFGSIVCSGSDVWLAEFDPGEGLRAIGTAWLRLHDSQCTRVIFPQGVRPVVISHDRIITVSDPTADHEPVLGEIPLVVLDSLLTPSMEKNHAQEVDVLDVDCS